MKYRQTLFGGFYLCIIHELLATPLAAQAIQSNKTANIVHKECPSLYVCTINKIDCADLSGSAIFAFAIKYPFYYSEQYDINR